MGYHSRMFTIINIGSVITGAGNDFASVIIAHNVASIFAANNSVATILLFDVT